MARKLQDFKFFCTVCKTHKTYRAFSEPQARSEFRAEGHDDTKTRALARGLVGVTSATRHPAGERVEVEVAA